MLRKPQEKIQSQYTGHYCSTTFPDEVSIGANINQYCLRHFLSNSTFSCNVGALCFLGALLVSVVVSPVGSQNESCSQYCTEQDEKYM